MVDKKIILLQQITKLIEQSATKSNNATLKKLCASYLQKHPYDTEIWLRFALLLHCFIKDHAAAIECLKTILCYNPGNVYVTMLLVFIAEKAHVMNDALFEQLCNLQPPNKEIASLIEYQKAWYYLEKDPELYTYALECSLALCDKFVWNYKALGSWYFFHNKFELGKSLFRTALKNICYVYTPQEYQKVGMFNLDDFFNAHLKGTHIMQPTMLMMLDVLGS